MKRILILTYYWPPSGGAGVQRWVKLSNYFAQRGMEVHVVTVHPDRASYALLDPTLEKDVHPSVHVYRTKTSEPYSIYKAITRKKQIPYGGFANEEKAQPGPVQKLMRFIRGNVFLPDARVGWNRFAYAAALRIMRKVNIDAVITTSPPHSTQLVGLELKKRFGMKWVADLRDPWTDIYYYEKLFLTDYSRRRDAEMEKQVLLSADAVVVVSEEIRRSFVEKTAPRYLQHIHVIPNGYDEKDFEQVELQQHQGKFVISYTGTLTSDYRIDAFLSAVSQFALDKPEVMLHVTGSFPVSTRDAIENKMPGRVKTLPHVAHHKAVEQMCSSDLLLLVIPDAKGNKGILTGKLFEYLASRKPVLCIGPVDGDAASIIRECSSGMAFAYEDAEGMKQFLEEKYSEWRSGGRTVAGDPEKITMYSRRKHADQVLNLIG
jgi:glycosyltransferase involved in cell wall biosynthesis